METEVTSKNEVILTKEAGWKYLLLALGAFMGLALEAVHFYGWEPLVYGISSHDWTIWQNILHWVLTCLTWGGVIYVLVYIAKNKLDFDIFAKREKMKLWQVFAALFGILFSITISYFDWGGGFKVINEFNNNGLLKFIFQYIYYMVETVLFLLIIVFGQKAFEIWTKKHNIPWGGIICGLTWGIFHLISRGYFDIQNGVSSMLLGFLFGAAYLFTNRDFKKSWLILFLMFAF